MTPARTGPRGPAPRPGAYETGAGDDRVPWGALLVRLFLLIPPAEVLGVLLLGSLLTVSGVLGDHPGLAVLFSVVPGALAGVAVGVFVTPPPGRLARYLGIAAGFGLATYLVLTALSRVRLAGVAASPGWSTYLLGALVVVGVQSLVTLGVWLLRARTR